MHSETEQHPAPAETGASLHFGSVICKAREAAGLSHTDLADKLNLSAQTIEYLEREQFDKLPAATFVRGYIRSIATHLNLNAEQLLSAYRNKGFDSEPQLVSTANRIKSPSIIINFAFLFRMLGFLLLWLLIIALGWYGFKYYKANAASSGDSLQLHPSDNAERLDINDTNRLTLSILTPSESASAAAPAAAENSENALLSIPSISAAAPVAPEPEPEPEPAPVAEAATRENLLAISATENAWVRIVDGADKVLIEGTIKPSDGLRQVVATPPVRLHLGNARNLQLQYRGKSVELSKFINSNNVAQLALK